MQSRIGCKLRKLWMLEIQICEKGNTKCPSFQDNSISQIYQTKIISLVSLIF